MKRKYILFGILLFTIIILISSRYFLSHKKEPNKVLDDNKTELKENESYVYETSEPITEAAKTAETKYESLPEKINEPVETAEHVVPAKSFYVKKVENNDEWKNNYELQDLKISKDDKITTIKGNIKNKSGNESATITSLFYDSNNKEKGSSAININVSVGETKEFIIKTLNNVASDNYKVFISE